MPRRRRQATQRSPPSPLLVAALMVLSVAGCLGGPDPQDPAPTSSSAPPSPPAPSPTGGPSSPPLVLDLLSDFAFEDCSGISVQSLQARDAVQALLPDGFDVAPPPWSQNDGAAIVGLDLYACGNLTTPNVRLASPVYGQAYTYVLRPEARVAGAPEAEVHEYVFRVLAGDGVLAQLWPAAGYDTRNGTGHVAVNPLGAGLPVDLPQRIGNGSVGADYALRATGTAGVLPIAATRSFARYTELEDGSVLVWTGAYSLPRPYDGQGVFDVADDDPFVGFEQAGSVPGTVARLYDEGSLLDMDLRRFFTSPAD